jgi:hypothetical protein
MEFVVNVKSRQCYALIQKNGTQSLKALTRLKPNQYHLVGIDYLIEKQISSITVFVREPIQRILSGIATQMQLYGITETSQDHLLNNQETLFSYDSHTIPQFWFLLKLSKAKLFLFDIKPLADLGQVDLDIPNINKNKKIINVTNPNTLRRLTHFYTEDIVLYNQFVGKLCHIDDIIEKIKLETNFIKDLQQYRHELTYLL